MNVQNDQFHVSSVIQNIKDVQRALRSQELTADASEDGKTLRQWLIALKDDVDQFLRRSKGHPSFK